MCSTQPTINSVSHSVDVSSSITSIAISSGRELNSRIQRPHIQLNELPLPTEPSKVLPHLPSNLAEWSNLHSDEMTLNIDIVRLDDLVARVQQRMQPQAKAKGLRLEVEVTSTARLDVASDSARLEQVLLQLINNAIQFTNIGRITVTLSTTVLPSGAVELFIEVQDTGVGIEPEELSLLLKRIANSDKNSLLNQEKPRLGLAICRKLAFHLGGTLTIRSLPRLGTTVTFIAQCCDIEPSWARRVCSNCRRTGQADSLCRSREEFIAHCQLYLHANAMSVEDS